MSGGLYKVEASGNDFVLGVGGWSPRLAAEPELAVRLCDRRRGIGADGVLAVEAAGPDRVRLRYRNADGSPARFCGNGTRCATGESSSQRASDDTDRCGNSQVTDHRAKRAREGFTCMCLGDLVL